MGGGSSGGSSGGAGAAVGGGGGSCFVPLYALARLILRGLESRPCPRWSIYPVRDESRP